MAVMTAAAVLALAAQPACSVPGMTPDFWPRVIRVESHYDPLALHDDTANQSFHPPTEAFAEELATRLMQHGHSVGVGLSQLTATNPEQFRQKFRITIREALHACENMHVGAQFYVNGALSIYNTGSPTRGIANGYVAAVQAVRVDAAAPNDTSPAAAPPPLRDALHAPDSGGLTDLLAGHHPQKPMPSNSDNKDSHDEAH